MSDVLQKLRDHILAHEITGNGETRLIGHVRQAAAELTRLRDHAAGLALERDGFQEECKRLRADLAAAQEQSRPLPADDAEMVEKVARAMRAKYREAIDMNAEDYWRFLADTAISAMRGEP